MKIEMMDFDTKYALVIGAIVLSLSLLVMWALMADADYHERTGTKHETRNGRSAYVCEVLA